MNVLTAPSEEIVVPLAQAARALPSVNLLPPEIGERRRFRRVQLGLGGGLLATVGVVALLQVSAVGATAQAERDLQAVSAQGSALRTEAAAFADVEGAYGRAADARALLAQAMGDEVRFSRLLDALSVSLPDDVWLKSITFTQAGPAATAAAGTPGIGAVSFTGVALSHEDVAAWLDSLGRQPGYADAYLTEATTGLLGGRSTVSFTSTVTLTPEALSGRHSAPAGG